MMMIIIVMMMIMHDDEQTQIINLVKTQVTEWGENGSLFLQPRLQISTMGLRAEDF